VNDIAWEEVPQSVSDECLKTKDKWILQGRMPTVEECVLAIRTAREHEYRLQQVHDPHRKPVTYYVGPRNEAERFWDRFHLTNIFKDDYQVGWGNLYSSAFDMKTNKELIDGYRRGLQDRHQSKANRLHRDWAETREGLAAAASLSDEKARYWRGPTQGGTRQARQAHRKHKRAITSQAFIATLKHSTIMQRWTTGAEPELVRIRLRTGTRAGGHSSEEEDYSLFTQYVARVEQLLREQKPGHTPYQQLQRLESDKMSRKRQMIELEKIGLALDSTAEAYKLYIQADDIMYPSTHTRYELPDIKPKTLKTAELLHHRYHSKEKN
jgi:hypothetical protein